MLELVGIVIGAAIALSGCVLWWLWQLWQTLRLVTAGQPRPLLRLRLRAARHIVILRSAEPISVTSCGNATFEGKRCET
jgi:hypothetical protein